MEPTTQAFKPKTEFKPFEPPIAYEEAKRKAVEIVNQLTLEEKISLIVNQ